MIGKERQIESEVEVKLIQYILNLNAFSLLGIAFFWKALSDII